MSGTGVVGNLVVNLSAHTADFSNQIGRAKNEANSFGGVVDKMGEDTDKSFRFGARSIDIMVKSLGRLSRGELPRLGSVAWLSELGPSMLGAGAAAVTLGYGLYKLQSAVGANIEKMREENKELAKSGGVITDYAHYLVAASDAVDDFSSKHNSMIEGLSRNWLKSGTDVKTFFTYYRLALKTYRECGEKRPYLLEWPIVNTANFI